MRFEAFALSELSSMGISIEDTATVLGYAKGSLRNKFSKGNLNLCDILAVGSLLGLNLSLCDNSGKSVYRFKPNNYLSFDVLTRLKSFTDHHMDDQKYSEWFGSLPSSVKGIIYNCVENASKSGK